MKIVADAPLREFVENGLLAGRSPESIAGRVNKQENHLSSISADSIERFLASVHGRRIEAARDAEKAKRRAKKRQPVTALSNRTFIGQRPKIINSRKRVGDVESDFIVSGKSGQGVLLTVVDRRLRVSFLEKIHPVTIDNVHKGFMRIKARYPEMLTITTDNDLLLARHTELKRLLSIKIYFCNPYHSWEKGTIENTNGVVRKYIPKSSDISQYSEKFIAEVEAKINDRYMECLDYATPAEVLEEYRQQKNAHKTRRKKQ